MRRAPSSLPRHQRGALLILLVIALGILAATVFVSMLSSSDIQNKRDKQTAAALAEAKAALIGYAASDTNRPGELPCPDYDGDGKITIPGDYNGSACKSYTGRLPWISLGLPDLRDGYGERLWYAVSVNFHANSTAQVNSNVPGQLSIGGISPANNVIAIVFAPGPPLSGQVRDATHVNDPTSYLEGNNALGLSNTNFTTANASATFNDRLLPITNANLFPAVEKRIAGEIIGTDTPTIGLRGYYMSPGYYPYAGDSSGNEQSGYLSGYVPYNSLSFTSATKNMLISNNWFGVTSYQVTISRDSAQLGLKYCTVTTTLGKQGVPVCH